MVTVLPQHGVAMALSWQLPCGQRVVSRLRLASFRSWKQASLCPFCPLEHFRLQPAVREGTVFTPRTGGPFALAGTLRGMRSALSALS